MKRLRVLKLGWEFPLLMNGGLGIACFGLSCALAKRVELKALGPCSGTSESEPFGIFALEAAQFGISAVITEVPLGALKADCRDAEWMATSITGFLTDDELRAKGAVQASHDIGVCTWDAAATKMLKIYAEQSPRAT